MVRAVRSSAILFVILALSSARFAPAQAITGEIDGTVTDSRGYVVTDASIVIRNTDTNQVAREVKSNSKGEYSATLLEIGKYVISVTAPGFEKTEIVAVQLNVSDTLTINAQLRPGAVENTVTVTAAMEAPNLETTEGASLINETQMKELALNTRNFQQMVLLQPGVSSSGPDELDPGLINPKGAANVHSLSVNGLRQNQLSWSLNGADILNHGGMAQVAVFPSVDSINQIKILRNSYGAQYGGGGGAQVIVASQSGGSALHGNVYYFIRSQYLNANDYLNKLVSPVAPRTPERYNNFGYSIGGPLSIPHVFEKLRDNTFFFVSQEFRRIAVYPVVNLGNYPQLAQASGYFFYPTCYKFKTTGTNYNSCAAGGVTTPVVGASPFPGYNYQVPASAMSSVAQGYLKDVILPAIALQPVNDANNSQGVIFSGKSTTSENQISVRIDHKFSDRFSGFLYYIFDPFHQKTPYGIYAQQNYPGIANASIYNFGTDYLGHGTFIATPSTVMDFGYSFLHFGINVTPTGTLAKTNSPDVNVPLPYVSTLNRVPSLTINGGTWDQQGQEASTNSIQQFFENTTRQAGRHTLYFGVNYEHVYSRQNNGLDNAGTFTFNGNQNPGGNGGLTGPALDKAKFEQAFTNFLIGRANTVTQSSVDAIENLSQNILEFYLQDNWRATAHLTLNAGVRYSIYGMPYDSLHHLGGLDPDFFNAAQAPTFGSDGTLCLNGFNNSACTVAANPNYNPTNGILVGGINSPFGGGLSTHSYLNFAPRVGFVYDVYGNGKTSLRGGYGIFYNQTAQSLPRKIIDGNPAYVINAVFSGTPPNTLTFQNPTGGIPPGLNVSSISAQTPHWTTPYTQEFSLDVQQVITRSWLLDIAYVGNTTQHLAGEEDLNQLMPGQAGISPGTGAAEAPLNPLRPYPGYGPINYYSTRYFADYNGLQISSTKVFSKHNLINASYTWSKALTNSSNANGVAPQNRFDLKPEWGSAAQDRRHILTANVVYDLPFFATQKGFKGHLLGGWEVSAIIQIASGLYDNVDGTSIDPAGQGNLAPGSDADLRPDQVGDPNTGPRTIVKFFNTAAYQYVPTGEFRPGNAHANQVEGPGQQTWNIDLFRNINLSHSMRLQIRMEAFNAFNHWNYNDIYTNFNNQLNFGHVKSFRDPRQLQLGVKFYY